MSWRPSRRFGYEDGSDRVVVEGDYNTWFSWWLNWYVVYLGGPDGLVADTWGRHYLADPHGNVVGVTDAAGTLSGSWSYDEYGNVASGATAQQWGWLGAQQRRVDATLGVTEMGARQYDPALGRFYSRDPVAGGSCGDYDYVCGDPVNNEDLDGLARRGRRQRRWELAWKNSRFKALHPSGKRGVMIPLRRGQHGARDNYGDFGYEHLLARGRFASRGEMRSALGQALATGVAVSQDRAGVWVYKGIAVVGGQERLYTIYVDFNPAPGRDGGIGIRTAYWEPYRCRCD